MRFIVQIDEKIILWLRFIEKPLLRFGLFLVYFWFGFLKVIFISPANPLVAHLLEKTLPFVTFDQFIFYFGLYEMLIAILFLLPGFERFAIALLVPHLVMTVGPLFLLPQITWSGFFVPTLEGQYIIKNILIIALAVTLAARLVPLKHK